MARRWSRTETLPLVVQPDAVAGLSLRLTRFRKAVRDVTDPHPRVQLFYYPFKDEAQAALFKDPARTAQ